MAKRASTGKDSNLIMGFYNATKSLGGIIGSLFAGLIYTRGPKLSFIFSGVVFLIATLFSVLYYKMKDKGAQAPAQPVSAK